MFLRIFILFFISLSLNAAEVVWDQESAKKVQKISDSDYQAALDSYLAELTANPKKAFEKGLQAEEQAEYKSALYFYRLSADKDHTPAKHKLAFLYARSLGISQADKKLIKKQTLEAKKILNKLNYNIGTIDGIYGLSTFNAIKSFQKDNASEPTGWIDSELLYELNKAEITYDTKARELLEEQKAKELANILETQQLLKNLAYYFGPLDGIYGAATADAIKNYQGDSASVQDGKVTPKLISSLKKSYNSYLNQLKNDKNLISKNFNAAVSAEEKGNYETALRLYTLSADQGNADAQYNLAWIFRDGQGVKQDYKKALRLYKLSADQGNKAALYSLGVMYKEGLGVKYNYNKSAQYFIRSSQ